MHTWLPDAHSEAPTPVSALLSGSLLAVSFYAILRFYQVAAAALGTGFPRDTLLAFGIASLLLAVAVRLRPAGHQAAARLLQRGAHGHPGHRRVASARRSRSPGCCCTCMAHAAAKANAFMGAGVFTVQVRHQADRPRCADGLRLLPWSGPLFLLAVFALSALPPFGIFRSEFQIVAGGLGSGSYAAAAVLVILVTLAFFGLITSATSMLLSLPASGRHRKPRQPGEPSAWMVVPVLAGLAVLFLLGIHPPGELTSLITQAAAQLGAR